MKKLLFVLGLFLLVLAACGPKQTATPAPTQAPATTTTETVAPPTQEATPIVQVPFLDLWQGSGHAKLDSEPFTHWSNEASKYEVPVACAKCHTGAGYLDFLGADGSEAGKVDAAVSVKDGNPGIQCTTCHNAVTMTLSEVTFPSGVTLSGLGPEARCMVCHQGRESKVSVDKQIADFNATDPDAVPAPIKDAQGNDVRFGFRNIHYYAAAATLFGSEVHGGYEYDGKTYDAKHEHVIGIDTCVACHDPHSLEVKVTTCQMCHQEVKSVEDLKNVREPSSLMDYDGDGNVTEGMYYEIQGLQAALYQAIQAYARDVAGLGITYNPAAYPYFFADADGDGKPDEKDGKPVVYSQWTPRLLKAAYNYQVSVKDPGSFAHGNKYIVQLLYDSIADINAYYTAAGKSPVVDMSKMHRDDAGHFAGNTEPFRHWDEEGAVPGTCARCHTAGGLPQFLKEGTTISAKPNNGFQCSTCHDEANWPNRYAVAKVTFPSGAVLSFGENEDSNLCLVCHQGRESKNSVDAALKGLDPKQPSDKIRFRNIHYFAAGATLFGTEAKGAYEYDGKTYNGMNTHPLNKCKDCHDVHKLEPKFETCVACHKDVTEPEAIRAANDTTDYDGDGNITEGIAGEIETLREALYAQIQAVAKANGTPIVYNAAAYPYFFVDKDEDGKPDIGEKGPIVYNAFSPQLLKAAYNYQYAMKDPGGYVHNPKYIIQILIDSIADLGGDVTRYVRP